MGCSVPRSYDQIKAIIEKQIQEDRVRQLAMMKLAHQFNDVSIAKDELRKEYKECRDIPLEQRAVIENFLKLESELDYKMNKDLLWNGAKLGKQIRDKKGQNNFQMNESSYINEPRFTKPESSFAFRSNDEYADEKNDSDDGVDENHQNMIHKWNKIMSFKVDIPDTPVYKSKPMISKQYSQQSEVNKGQNFDNKEALVLAVRLKALNDGF
nr:hypothetical protein [Tanacetum cinerariifolium]